MKQGFFQEVRPDGTIIRGFSDHFGPDLDIYICRHLDQEPPDEPPEDVEYMLKSVMCRDPQPKAKHVRLLDIADDGTIYT